MNMYIYIYMHMPYVHTYSYNCVNVCIQAILSERQGREQEAITKEAGRRASAHQLACNHVHRTHRYTCTYVYI